MGGKNSYSGVEWAVHPDALLSELDKEDNVKNELKRLLNFKEDDPLQLNLLDEAKSAVEAWYKVYHTVLLLTTMIYPLQENIVINREEPNSQACLANPNELCLEVGHIAPAYTLDEEYSASEFPKYGVILEKRIKEDLVKRRLGIEGNGSTFVDEHIKAQPRFKFFFDQLNPFLQKFTTADFTSPDSEWNQEDCLKEFRDAVFAARVSPEDRVQYEGYVDRLHNLLTELWGADIKAHLEKMRRWLVTPGGVGSEDWWVENLSLAPLQNDISNLFASGDGARIKESHKIAAISYLNQVIFTFIQIRFEEPDDPETSHGLIGVLDRYSEVNRLAGNSNAQIWADILSITSGVLAWQIFRQAASTVAAMKKVICEWRVETWKKSTLTLR